MSGLTVTNIVGDTNGKRPRKRLPKRVEIPADVFNDWSSDYLSDEHDYLVADFTLESSQLSLPEGQDD
jgi:hypothetical protein